MVNPALALRDGLLNFLRQRCATLISTIFIFGLYLVWINCLLPDPVTLTTISALSERAEFSATDRRLSAFSIGKMRFASSPLREQLGCLDGVVTPDVATTVAFERGTRGNNIAISIVSGSVEFEARSGALRQRISGPVDIVVDENCPGEAPDRFPIWGQLRLGEEMRPPSGTGTVQLGLLLEGRLKVQARAMEHWSVPLGRETLYPVVEMELPVGARVESKSAGAGAAAWWGTVYIDPQKVGLQVQVGTESQSLAVFRPGRTDADVVTVTALTQVFSDPNVIRLQIFVLVFFGILQFVAIVLPVRDSQ